MSCSAPSESVKNCGFDAVYAYNWGTEGYSPDYTKSRITEQREKNILHVVPTVSTGFNSIGWDRPRTPLMTCEDMGEMLRWFKEDVLPDNKGEDWKRKFVMFSTWNMVSGSSVPVRDANISVCPMYGTPAILRETLFMGAVHTHSTFPSSASFTAFSMYSYAALPHSADSSPIVKSDGGRL